ncbi:D-beta-hydroxybutyrate dehydrogenase [Roseovarius sp. THAF9]|uniref:SDR family NAD(P)-dependent oxidoreductase n=1 Tax=Roseovarius sp. THAF9 TaxID=2587847 RepID=UPI00126966BD|nr:SDR family oxidoreductase [Roseovarius sp. THAF9]QFT93750.1 D-beta-hydroxybutyrate dehydrogenase [Roseovarius sp. THAF9]
MTLTGKHALVTGGGTGIGLAIARALQDNGAEVTITGRRADVLDEAAGAHGLHAQVMDVRDEASVVEGIAASVTARGPIQICVPNAGIAEGRNLSKTDTDFWHRTMATNLDGAFWTIRSALASMKTTDWGRVVAISSIAGIRGLKGAAAYSASKHGLIGLIRALSEDYMGSAFTFNAVCPGYVDTDIVTRNVDAISARAGVDADTARSMMVDANRHKRLIDPFEVAAAVTWLCDPGSQSVNGQTIEIAGGQV